MAWRIEANVVTGEIDNTIKGRVTGHIWLAGNKAPIGLDLKGNCLRDLAGCRVAFSNSAAKLGDTRLLAAEQTGICGDLTVSRRAKISTVPIESISDWAKAIPFKWGNIIHLEWFSGRNGRVVIEAANYHYKTSLPMWKMTKDEDLFQRRINQAAMSDFMRNLERRLGGADMLPEQFS